MIGGIYCEVPLGPIFNGKTVASVNSRMRELFGKDLLQMNTLTQQIIDYWYDKMSKKMRSVLLTWKVPTDRFYYNRTVDLTRSICLGVYNNGKLRKMYRFNEGFSEKRPNEPNEWGSGISGATSERLSQLGNKHHPNPAARAQQFLSEYDLIHKRGYVVVVAATMPYAVWLEKRLALPVLSLVINRILKPLYDFGAKSPFYGYIISSGDLT